MTPSSTAAARRLWSVRTQISLLGLATALMLVVGVTGTALVLHTSRSRFDQEDALLSVGRARVAIRQSLEADRGRVTDFAWWDELYGWVDRPHPAAIDAFLRDNFINTLPAKYGDQYIGIWRADRTPVALWHDSVAATFAHAAPISSIFDDLDQKRAAAGYLTLGGAIYRVSGAVILPSDLTRPAPSHGYLITAQKLDDSTTARLSVSLQQRVGIRPVILHADSTNRIVFAGGDSVATSFGMTDMFGAPKVRVELRASRAFLRGVEGWMQRLLAGAILLGGLFLILLVFVVSRYLMRPFERIGAQFARMRAEGRIFRLEDVPTAREWAHFTAAFNHLADARERAERQLADARDEALASTRAKSDFLANMSHEIRTPMNAILGLSDLLRRTPLAPEQLRYVEAVHGSGEALLTLVNDILDLSKVEAGKLTIETVPFDLRRAIEETVAIFTHRAAERGVRLEQEISTDVPQRVLGDPGRLRQVLTNLVGNALKFTKDGRVLVRVAVDDASDDAVIRFEIEDTGIGIPADKLERIFEKFAQADASTTRKFGGTGLGLSISRQLVELMGGSVTVRSEVNRGSTFAFTVPLPVCTGVPAHLPRDLPLTGFRLLHVSADGVPDPALTTPLVAAGVRVTESPAYLRPEEALLAAAETREPFQFVLIEGEQMSPAVQHAIAACRRELWPAVAIVTMVRRGFRGMASHARMAGAHACLVHPVSAQDLREALAIARQVVQGGLSWPLITRQWLLEARAAETNDDELAAAGANASQGARVLVTDDNELNRLVASEYLKRQGAEVVTAASGAEALGQLAEGGFDLVFMDCQMPELDGYETTARIRQLPGEFGQVPIVAMTANAMQGDRDRCLAAGMNDYVSKPIRESDISRSLRRWASTSRAPRTGLPQAAAPMLPAATALAINPGALSALIGSGPGGAGLAARLTTLYLRDTPAQLRALRLAVDGTDWGDVARIAHTLRGASGVMGASIVVDLCARLEDAAGTESEDAARQTLALLEREAARALQALGGTAADAPAIDPVKLAEYRRMDAESPGLSQTLFQLFLRDAPGRMTRIEEALALDDATELQAAAHLLKGAALQLGAAALGTLVGEIESDAKRGDVASARGRFPQAVREWERARDALSGELDPESAQVAGVA